MTPEIYGWAMIALSVVLSIATTGMARAYRRQARDLSSQKKIVAILRAENRQLMEMVRGKQLQVLTEELRKQAERRPTLLH